LVEGLQPRTYYSFRASAVNARGAGDPGPPTSGARPRLPCSPPRAACSGLGACTVRWEEPFSNGAAVEFYQVEGKAEVVQKFRRSVPSHLRHLVVRGLATGGDYVFRVAASNTAGLGEAGPWTEVVRVEDPADQG
ncbi:unnamed protein product, partial [Scytosiphon promiscuus]